MTGRRERPTGLLLDLDGVLRRWDPEVNASVERRYGLTPGALARTAMEPERLWPALVGKISHADWMAGVADALAGPAGGVADAPAGAGGGAERARAAVAEWQRYRGEVDPEVLAFVREVRAVGIRVGLATNATGLLDADLAALGLTGETDVVVSSAVLGVHKPAREYLLRACQALGTPPDRVLFVDDEDRVVRGARAAGLAAYRWSGPADLRYLRAALVAG